MGRFIVAAVALLIGAALGTSFGYERWHGLFPGYVQHRAIVIKGQSPFVPDGSTLAIGDSTVERVYAADLCGGAFNAAISWATIRQVIGIAPSLVAEVKPRTVIVGVGENDLEGGTSPQAFRADYLKLISLLGSARLVLVGIPNEPAGSRIVHDIAMQRHASYVAPVEGTLTLDGVHESARGAAEWRRRVAAACETS